MSKHTPGPWHVGTQNDLLYVIDRRPATSNDYPDHNADVAAIAKVYCGNESEANARLIATAPELLEALRGMMAAYEELHARYDLGECQATVDARAAIAKATGEQP